MCFFVFGSRKLGEEWRNSWCARDGKSGDSAGTLEKKGDGMCK